MLIKNPAISFKSVSKSFPGVKALDDITFDVQKNSIHAIVGENGAGKSTLLNILHGIYPQYDGEVFIEGEIVNFNNASQALQLGIVKVHQEVSMVPELTVGQNVVLGYEKTNGLFVDLKEMNNEVNSILSTLGCSFRSETKASKLDIGELQMASIAKAIYHKAKIISFDEPTASLSSKEKINFFKTIGNLKEQGLSIIYISHHLEEIFEICDTVTILRDGKFIDTFNTTDITKNQLVKLMVGREVKQLNYTSRDSIKDENILEVKNLTINGVFEDISFNLKKGEILGFSGLVGAKRTDVMLTLIGALNKHHGEVLVNGKQVKINSPLDAVNLGIGLVPENRKTQGFIKYFNNSMNIAITKLPKFVSNLFLNKNMINSNAKDIGESLNLHPNIPSYLTANLSGGNQQKVVISKWLSAEVDILILDEPTKGVDIGAKSEIYAILNKFVSQGKSIIIVSSELPEILGMSDRIIVMKEGKIAKELTNEDLTEEIVLQYAMGV